MPIAKITGQGLASMALAVGLLWACVIGERVLVERAETEAAETVRAMHILQRKARRIPAGVPARLPPAPVIGGGRQEAALRLQPGRAPRGTAARSSRGVTARRAPARARRCGSLG
jgi:hypothetical protein